MTFVRRQGRGGLLAAAAASIIAVAGLAGPADAQPGPAVLSSWPQLQGNAGHTGAEPGEQSVTGANVKQLAVAWTAKLPAGRSNASEVAVTGGVAYVGAAGTVTAFDAATGTQLWQQTVAGSVLGTPAVAEGLVLVANQQQFGQGPLHDYVTALSSATGTVVWRRSATGFPCCGANGNESVTIAGDHAYLLEGSQVAALTVRHGRRLWMSPALAGCQVSQPSVSGGYVVVGGGGTNVTALHTLSGKVAWHQAFPSGHCGSGAPLWLPSISGHTVYAGLISGVASLDLTSGAVGFHVTTTGTVWFPVSLTHGEVVFVGGNGYNQLSAVSQSSGRVVWTHGTAPAAGIGVASFGHLIWSVADVRGSAEVVAASPVTGRRIYASAALPGAIDAMPPVVAAGHVYANVGSEVVCLALPAGR